MLQDGGNTEQRISSLQRALVDFLYSYVSRSLFKADRLMFALHLVHGMYSDLFQENVSFLVASSTQMPEQLILACYNKPNAALVVHELSNRLLSERVQNQALKASSLFVTRN